MGQPEHGASIPAKTLALPPGVAGLARGSLTQTETMQDLAAGGLSSGEAPEVPAHQLLRPIGEGAYGTIWLAINAMGTYRAVKVLHRSRFHDARPYEREYDGIKHFEPLSRSHDGFVDILQVERNDEAGYFYYVMELADDIENGQHITPATYQAKTLADERQKRSWLPLGECLQIAMALSSALEHLHKNNLVHRDIKAANIVFVNGTPKVADIGLVSEIKADSTFVGTPGFIPPEGPGSPPADIYSLGKVLYEISTGLSHREFPALPQTAAGPLDHPGFHEWNTILLKACADNVKVRYHSATEMQAHLALVRAGKSVKRLLEIERYLRLARQYGPITVALLLLIPLVLFQVVRERKRAAEERQRQVGSYVAYGSRAFADGELLAALPWFVRALEFDQGDTIKEWTDRVRIGSALAHAPKLIQLQAGQNRSAAHFGASDDEILSQMPGERTAIWRVSDGQRISPWLGEGKNNDELSALSRDHKRVALFNSGTVARVCDAGTGELLSSCGGAGWILSAQFDPTGERLVTVGNGESEARVWRVAGGQEELTLTGSTHPLWAALFSPDGRRVVGASMGGQAVVWDAKSGQRLLTFSKHSDWVHEAAFSPDSKLIATASGDHTARVWEAETGREVLAPLQHDDHVFGVEFSPDGRLLVTACLDGTVRLWDTQTGHLAYPTLTHHTRVSQAAFSPSGARLLSVCIDGTICVWDLSKASPVALGPGVAFSGDGLVQVRSREGKLGLTRSSDDQALGSVEAGPQRMSELALDRTGRILLGARSVSGTNGGAQLELQVWDLQRSANLVLRLTNAPGSKLFLSSTGTRLAAAAESAVTIWSNPAGEEPWMIAAPSVKELAFDHSGSRVALAHGQVVEVWDLVSQPAQRRYTLNHKLEVNHVEFAPDDRLLLTACSDPTLAPGMAQVWDAQSGRAAGPALFHRDGVVYATFSPQGERILTCSEDFTAVLWDTATGQRRAVPSLRHREQVVYGAFSQNGHWVATVERDGAVRVWDAFTAELVMPPLRHAKPISSAQFVAGDTRLAVRAIDGAMSVWELPRDPRPIEDLSRIATVLNGQRPDDAVGPAAKAEPDWIRTWAELKRRYPGEFGGRAPGY